MKPSKGNVTAPQKHIHSRISYLYQAATYLSQSSSRQSESSSASTKFQQGLADTNTTSRRGEAAATEGLEEPTANAVLGDGDVAMTQRTVNIPSSNAVGLPCFLLSHVRTVSMKSQVRLSSTIKNSICKRCDILLVPGSTSTTRVENRSRGGKKPWANVLVIKCNLCGAKKRFPIGAKRQPKRSERSIHSGKGTDEGPVADGEISGLL